jgi:hypothetical protein
MEEQSGLRFAYAAAGVVLAGVILAALVSLIVRFRRARGTERQQLKWFAYGTALLLFLPAAALSGASVPAPAIASAIPVTIGLAVLRYRLYDIDRLINRTLVHGLLTEVDLDALSAELLAVADRTVEPMTLSLWLRPPLQRSERPAS